MYRYQILIEYVGTSFVGWQIQKKGTSIQKVVQITLSKLLKQNILLYGSGRTDAGVHAKEQSAHFDVKNKIQNIDKIIKSLNYFLNNKMISIIDIKRRKNNFHARYSAKERIYLYIIRKKTSSLFETAAWSGGILSEFDKSHCDMLKIYSENSGYAFQIFDDIKDFSETENYSLTGKNPGIDIANGIFTLPVIISLNDKQNNPFLNSTDQINMKNAKDYLDSNGYMKQSIDIGNEYIFSAKNSLKLFSNSDLKYLLCEIADSIN